MAAVPDFPQMQAEGEALPGDDAKAREEQKARVQAFAMTLLKTRTEAITNRSVSGVERRWMDDLDAYHGRDAFNRPLGIIDSALGAANTTAGTGPTTNPQQTVRSTVYVQLTRQKTNTAAARVQEMLFPSDDKNWGIGPTPVPQLMKSIKTGQNVQFRDPETRQPLQHPDEQRPLTVADVAADELREAVEKAERMEKRIHDKLEQCGYNAVGRQIIMDAAKLGTGILKGPIVVNSVQQSWEKVEDATGVVRVLRVKDDKRPASFRVDPWDFFPDPSCGENVQDGSFVWEREWCSGRKLRQLAKNDAYDREAIVQCLQEGPMRITATGQSYYELSRSGDAYNQQSAYEDRRYELWTYSGEVDKEGLEILGIPLPEGQEDLASFSAIVVFCNDRPIKWLLNPLDTGDLPYDVFVWEKVDLSPFGVGIPYLMRYAQRTINAAWRALLDNMGVSAGPQIVMSREVTPVDGRYEITGRKLWTMEPGGDVDKAFRVYEVPSRQNELTGIIRLAMEFADSETALPMIAQGDANSAPDTVGVTNLLMNASNTVQKRIARQFDDSITKPHLKRYYDWHMQYDPDDSIKGDMEVSARGSTALVQRDIRNQSIDLVVAAATHPVFGAFVEPEKLFRVYLESKSITPDSVMKDMATIKAEEEARKKQPPPPTPQEKVAMLRGQATIKQTEIETQSEMANEKARQQDREREREHDIVMKNLEVQLLALKYAQERGMRLDELRTELAMFVMDKKSQKEMATSQQDHDLMKESFKTSQPKAGSPA